MPKRHQTRKPRTVRRPTCCENCRQLYDAVHARCARARALLGPSPYAVDPGVLYEAIQERRPCLLCGAKEIAHAQLFLPQHIRWRSGAVLFFLCAACLSIPTPARALRVEAAIMAGLVGRRN